MAQVGQRDSEFWRLPTHDELMDSVPCGAACLLNVRKNQLVESSCQGKWSTAAISPRVADLTAFIDRRRQEIKTPVRELQKYRTSSARGLICDYFDVV